DLEHVQAGSGDGALLQRCDQGLLVDDAAAGDVDQRGRVLHQAQFAGADQMAGLGGGRDGQDHVVAALEHLVQLELGDAHLGAEVGPRGAVPGDDLEVQGGQLAHGLLSDAAQSDHADGRGGQAGPAVEGLAVPLCRADQMVLGQQVVGQGEQEGQCGVGHRYSQPGGGVGDGDAAGVAGGEVDLVV